MSTPVATILGRAATILGDIDKVRWTLDELLDYGNEGQLALAIKFQDAKVKTINQQLVAGARQTLPDDGIKVLDVRQSNDGSAVTPCDRPSLDLAFPGWMHKQPASFVKHWMDDENPSLFYVYPAQNDTPATIRMSYSARPGALSSTGVIDIRDVYAERLVNYIIYRALSKDAEFSDNANRAVAYHQAALS